MIEYIKNQIKQSYQTKQAIYENDELLKVISKNLPDSPFLYDKDNLTSELVRDIYAGFIREGIFEM